jgi:hypothetical protein
MGNNIPFNDFGDRRLSPKSSGGFGVDDNAAQLREFPSKAIFQFLGDAMDSRDGYACIDQKVKREVDAAAYFVQLDMMSSVASPQFLPYCSNPLNIGIRFERIQRGPASRFLAARFYMDIDSRNDGGSFGVDQFRAQPRFKVCSQFVRAFKTEARINLEIKIDPHAPLRPMRG